MPCLVIHSPNPHRNQEILCPVGFGHRGIFLDFLGELAARPILKFLDRKWHREVRKPAKWSRVVGAEL